jgi:hypothetical protein
MRALQFCSSADALFAQFAFLFVYGVKGLATGSLAKETVITNCGVQALMLVLFYRFYARTYGAQERATAKSKEL